MSNEHAYVGMEEDWPYPAKTCRERLLAENKALRAELADRDRPNRYPPDFSALDRTSAFIQWKGTDVCLDFTCECGGSGHVDAMFVYTIKCPDCGRVWAMPHTVSLVESTDRYWTDSPTLVEVDPGNDEEAPAAGPEGG
jgi:hypothetical protein